MIPTKTEDGYAVPVSYAGENFEEDIPDVYEAVAFAEDITGKTVTVYCIDRSTTNPYRLFEKMGSPEPPDEAQIARLREAGQLRPVSQYLAASNCLEPICLK